MTRLEIYGIALSQHGKRCTQEEIDTQVASEKPVEVEACDTMYDMAVENALSEFDWSFCLTPLEVDRNDDVPYGKWEHGYRVDRSDFIRLARVDTVDSYYIMAGDRLYTNEDDPKLWCIRRSAKVMAIAPKGFCHLVGLYLGFLISSIISPSDTTLSQRILQNYSGQLSSLMKSEINNVTDSYERYDDYHVRCLS